MRISGSACATLAPLIAASAIALSCSPSMPVRVGVVFGSNWVLGPVSLTEAEQRRIKNATFETVQRAFSGFAVDFAEDPARDRVIRLTRRLFGSGATPIGSKVSDVNLDAVYLTLLSVTGCPGIASCAAYPRATLVDALGRGIGATAAHELGHQAGLMFTREAICDDCYDGVTSDTRAHFFGEKHWSPQASATMTRVFTARAAHSARRDNR